MVEHPQGVTVESHSPEVVEAAPSQTALVTSFPDPKRGRVGRWWKRVVESGTQGGPGFAFPGLERLRKLEDEHQALAESLDEQLRDSEARTLEHLEKRLETLEAERSQWLERALEERLAKDRSRMATVGGVAALAVAIAVAASLLALGWIPH